MPMMVQIALSAGVDYRKRVDATNRPAAHHQDRDRFNIRTLDRLQGQWVYVNIEYLFKDRFSLLPIAGIIEHGFTVMESEVSGILDDKRDGRAWCGWCAGHQLDFADTACHWCGRKEYMESFDQPKASS